MYVFIDEAGDVGFKLNSSKYFVLVLLIFNAVEEVDKASSIIQRQKIKDRIRIEYKSAKTNKKLKENFFNCIKFVDFKITALIIKKSAIYNKELIMSPKTFYSHFLRKIISESLITDAIVEIDKSSSPIFQQQIRGYLLKNLEKGKVKRFRFENSKSNNLIQFADMIAGALIGYYQKRNEDNKRYRKIFESKIIKEIVIE